MIKDILQNTSSIGQHSTPDREEMVTHMPRELRDLFNYVVGSTHGKADDITYKLMFQNIAEETYNNMVKLYKRKQKRARRLEKESNQSI
jgi:hypothetical protein